MAKKNKSNQKPDRLSAAVQSALAAGAAAARMEVTEYASMVLSRIANDPFGLWAEAAVRVEIIEISPVMDQCPDDAEITRKVLVEGATAGAKVLSVGGNACECKAAVREGIEFLAHFYGNDAIYEELLEYACGVAHIVWNRTRPRLQ